MPVEIRRVRAAPLLLVLAFVAVACGGGSTVKQTSAVELADPPNVSAGTLKLSDFPEGWTVDEKDPNEADEDEETKCAPATDTTTIDSKSFVKGDWFATNSIDIFESVPAATADIALGRQPAFLACFGQELVDEIAKDADPSVKVTGSALQAIETPKFRDETLGLTIGITATGPGGTATIVYQLIIVRVGRITSAYFFLSSGEPFDVALRNQLIEASSKRLPVLP